MVATPQTALVEIMDYGQEGAAFCGPRGIPIVTDAVAGLEQNDSVARKRSQQKLAELGAWAVGRTVRDTCVAMRLASTSQVVALTPAVQDDFTSRNDHFMHDRKLDDDALFAPLLRSVTEQGAPSHRCF